MQPAGIVRRYAAWSLDAAVLALVAWAVCHQRIGLGLERCREALAVISDQVAHAMLRVFEQGGSLFSFAIGLSGDGALRASTMELAAAVTATLWPPVLAFALMGLPYHALFESSRPQATPGKRALGLRVVGADGGRIGLGRAWLRQMVGVLSWLSLNLGHAWAAVPPRRQALHDAIARARVVQPEQAGALPMWARAWIAFQVALSFAALAWLLQTTNAALQGAFDALL